MNEYIIGKLLNALNGGEVSPRELWNIYNKNNKEQQVMRALAIKTNTNPNGIDHYYHRKSMYEAAQKGKVMGTLMFALGGLKEGRDILRDSTADIRLSDPDLYKLYKFTKNLPNALDESKKDLQNNYIGYRLAMDSNLPAELNPEFNKYNSATVNMLLPRMPKDTQ